MGLSFTDVLKAEVLQKHRTADPPVSRVEINGLRVVQRHLISTPPFTLLIMFVLISALCNSSKLNLFFMVF